MIDSATLAGFTISFIGLGLATLIALIKLIAVGQDLRTTVDQIKVNDLPHLHAEVKELRKEFTQHLLEVKNESGHGPVG